MWELIRANKRKSVVLLGVMGFLLLALGFSIGGALGGYFAGGEELSPDVLLIAGGVGVLVAGGIWFVLAVLAFYQGSRIMMASSRAHKIEKDDYPQLYNVVEEMTIASGRGTMPEIYVIDDMGLNAFATGRDPEHSAIAVTSGLLAQLNRDELQGVVAHEMSHINNRDILYMTMAGVMVGSIVILSDVFLRGLFYGSHGARRSRRSSGSGGGQAQMVLLVVALLLAVLAPILAHLIYFAASRRREYLADACGAMLTRYPEGLASALEKIAHGGKVEAANRVTAPMYISSPKGAMKANAWSSTHPPVSERIEILRGIGGGGSLSYGAYQEVWSRVSGGKAGHLPASAVETGEEVAVREPSVPAEEKEAGSKGKMREVSDLIRKVNGFLFLSCACGLKMKIPPDFKQDHVKCPKCSRDVAVPVAHLAALDQVADALDRPEVSGGGEGGGSPIIDGLTGGAAATAEKAKEEVLEIQKNPSGWTTAKCRCGHTLNLSPQFAAPRTRCQKCNRKIVVRGVE